MKSKLLALSAVSAGFIAVVLTVGAYVQMADLFAVIISSAFVILPLYYKSYKGSFLCCLAGGVLAFVFSGFNVLSIVFPSYFLFFGIYPVVSTIAREKGFNKYVFAVLGAVWCVAVVYGIYFYYTFVMKIPFDDLPEKLAFIKENLLYFLGAVGVIFYFVYDRFIVVVKYTADRYLGRIIR